jgi:hypothetical protein
MPNKTYRAYGMPPITEPSADAFITHFEATARAAKDSRGVFLGVDFLKGLVKSLEAGDFDGLEVRFGATPNRNGRGPHTYGIIAKEVKVDDRADGKYVVTQVGNCHTSRPDSQTQPATNHPPGQ